MRVHLVTMIAAALALAGCGAEVAGTAATVGKLQTEQAQQALKQQEQITKNLGAALQAGQAATASAAAAQN